MGERVKDFGTNEETQPPPDVAPPPPAEKAMRSRTVFKVTVAVSIVGALFVWIEWHRLFMREYRNRPQDQAMSNLHQIGLALMEFEKDYGSYPDGDTIARVKETTSTDLSLGTANSNDFFRQLLAAGYGNENMNYARIPGSRSPDGVIAGTGALKKGECGFAYIPGLSSSDNAHTPVLITPLVPGTDKIDPVPFGGKAIILRIDGSAQEGMADKDGHLIIFGKRLLDPTNPIWNGKPPTLVWPE